MFEFLQDVDWNGYFQRLAVMVVITVICVMLLIFSPNTNFYTHLYDFTEIEEYLNDEMHNNFIMEQIPPLEEIPDFPGKLWNQEPAVGSLKFLPFYIFDEFNHENIKKCPSIFYQAMKLKDIKTAGILVLDKMTVLKVHMGWAEVCNDTLRCIIPIRTSVNDIKRCGVWVNGETRKIGYESVVFDASKNHSMYNNTDQPCYMLMLDIKRPKKMHSGNSKASAGLRSEILDLAN